MRLWGDTGGYCGKGFGHVVDTKYTQTNIHAKGYRWSRQSWVWIWDICKGLKGQIKIGKRGKGGKGQVTHQYEHSKRTNTDLQIFVFQHDKNCVGEGEEQLKTTTKVDTKLN